MNLPDSYAKDLIAKMPMTIEDILQNIRTLKEFHDSIGMTADEKSSIYMDLCKKIEETINEGYDEEDEEDCHCSKCEPLPPEEEDARRRVHQLMHEEVPRGTGLLLQTLKNFTIPMKNDLDPFLATNLALNILVNCVKNVVEGFYTIDPNEAREMAKHFANSLSRTLEKVTRAKV
jgi:hypothetical protein